MTQEVSGLRVALAIEWLKLRRSPVAWTTAAAIAVLVPLVSVGGYAASRAGGRSAGALKVQAMIHGTGWDAVWSLGSQVIPVTLLLGTGVVASWCVGREFTDGTVGGLFATNVPRALIAVAKLVLVTAWAAAVTAVAAGAVLLGGAVLGLAPLAGLPAAGQAVVVGVLVSLSALPAAWAASAGRGYLPGIACTVGLLVLTQLAVAVGGDGWIPWAAPAFWAGAAGPAEAARVTWLQLSLPALVGVGSVVLVARWWSTAELGNA